MIISKDKTITDDEYNRLQWEELPVTAETLTAVFAGKEIVSAEAIDFPVADGICFCLFADEQMTFVDVSVSDDLTFGDAADCETPLIFKVSEPIALAHSPA